MLFKLTQGMFVMLILACCGCQERQSNVVTTSSGLNGQQKNNPAEPTVTVYYFHRTARCYTCLSIEASAAQVIKDNFPQQLADGRVLWMPFNLEDPGGEEFQREFDITTSTLVVAKRVDADRVEFEKLDKVWELLGDPDQFSEYVTQRIDKFLNVR